MRGRPLDNAALMGGIRNDCVSDGTPAGLPQGDGICHTFASIVFLLPSHSLSGKPPETPRWMCHFFFLQNVHI